MEMLQRTDTRVTRHNGGWIVLGTSLLVVCFCGTALRWTSLLRLPFSPGVMDTASAGFPRLGVDVNAAGPAELCCIPGVGPALAKRIVDHRQIHGSFQSLSDLEHVPGIGPQLSLQLAQAMLPLPDPAPPRSAPPQVVELVGRIGQHSIDEPLHD